MADETHQSDSVVFLSTDEALAIHQVESAHVVKR